MQRGREETAPNIYIANIRWLDESIACVCTLANQAPAAWDNAIWRDAEMVSRFVWLYTAVCCWVVIKQCCCCTKFPSNQKSQCRWRKHYSIGWCGLTASVAGHAGCTCRSCVSMTTKHYNKHTLLRMRVENANGSLDLFWSPRHRNVLCIA